MPAGCLTQLWDNKELFAFITEEKSNTMSCLNAGRTMEVDCGEKQLSSACLYQMTFAYAVLFLIHTSPKCYRNTAHLCEALFEAMKQFYLQDFVSLIHKSKIDDPYHNLDLLERLFFLLAWKQSFVPVSAFCFHFFLEETCCTFFSPRATLSFWNFFTWTSCFTLLLFLCVS